MKVQHGNREVPPHGHETNARFTVVHSFTPLTPSLTLITTSSEHQVVLSAVISTVSFAVLWGRMVMVVSMAKQFVLPRNLTRQARTEPPIHTSKHARTQVIKTDSPDQNQVCTCKRQEHARV